MGVRLLRIEAMATVGQLLVQVKQALRSLPILWGTTFANVPTGTKTGDIRLNWTALTGTVYPPAISAVYESNNGGAATLAPIVVGPPTDFSSSTGGNGYDYCFYSSTNYNLNAAQTLVFELKDPQSGDIFGYCAYDFTTNPPTSTSLPAGLPLDAGTIAGNQSICTGGNPVAFTSPFDASGGTGSLTYSWESSTDNVTWSTIAGATTNVYDAPAGLTVDTYYRRVVTDGSTTKTSNSVLVTIGSHQVLVVRPPLPMLHALGEMTELLSYRSPMQLRPLPMPGIPVLRPKTSRVWLQGPTR